MMDIFSRIFLLRFECWTDHFFSPMPTKIHAWRAHAAKVLPALKYPYQDTRHDTSPSYMKEHSFFSIGVLISGQTERCMISHENRWTLMSRLIKLENPNNCGTGMSGWGREALVIGTLFLDGRYSSGLILQLIIAILSPTCGGYWRYFP